MPGKSRRAKSKRYQVSKKRSAPRENTVAEPAAATAAGAAAPRPVVMASKAPARRAADATAIDMATQYSYVPGDLRRIGVLTGIVFIILIVLYLFLR